MKPAAPLSEADPVIRASFEDFFLANKEKGYESVSGVGSSRHETQVIRNRLPSLFRDLSIASLIDAPCGDMNWMADLDYEFRLYIGIDIVADIIFLNRQRVSRQFFFFETADITVVNLPRVDAIFCRDCLVHLPNRLANKALDNFTRSGSTYLITTHFIDVGDADLNAQMNREIPVGRWRPVRLTEPPFSLPAPVQVLDEQSRNRHAQGKTLGVWRLNDIGQRGIKA